MLSFFSQKLTFTGGHVYSSQFRWEVTEAEQRIESAHQPETERNYDHNSESQSAGRHTSDLVTSAAC